ncbi:unnamed protein product [Plutella xylostella]|uniref:RNA-directed DNA polymerase n=1 Tax=Plutella xylostella TaxID=51655 RepID=A0A8S4FMB7_PLUXY|nr:unnamed protein product [Plutella xylostella]
MYAIKFLSLQKSELEYEVAIRGTTPCSKVADLRKQIVKLVSEYPSEEVLESPFDVVEDLTGCLEVLGKVEKILQEPQPDIAVVKRAENLLNHLYHRLHRIAPTEESKVQYDETLSLYKNFVGQFRSFLEKGVDTLSMCSSSQEPPSDQLGTPVINVTCDRSSILDLGKIKFDGDTCVRAFIERVSEYCSARNISDARLLSFGTEIFTGNALHWFRSVRDQVSSWDELKALLRQDFDTLDFDYRLLAEIRARTQGESENITIYLSIISGIDFWRAFKICPKYLGSITLSETSLAEIKANTPEVCLQSYNNLDEAQKLIADNIVQQFKDISIEVKGLGRTSLITHHIDTGDAQPIRQRYYRMSPEKQRILQEQVDEMLELDVVDRCESAWSSPVLIVYKSNGQPRFCLDSRKLNSVTKRDAYNLPYVSEILDNLRDAKFLSSVDLSKAFWQIPIAPEDQEKTAFYVPGRGTLKFKTTAFGLTNAPATQQRLVDMLFGDFDLKTFAYLDDIIVVSSSFEEHVSLLLRVLEKLKHANLTINLEKCKFFRSQLKYLGYVVDEHGLRTDPSKVEAILNYPTPTSRKDLKRFLGTATWYRRFVPNFSTVAGPLNKLTSNKKNAPPFKWTPEVDASFNKLKECLVSAPVLSCPNYDLPFEVHTDASDYGVGAMLTQTVDGKEHPIAYMSRSLTGAEKNYSITERETLAVITALEHWRCYLENGQTFTVYTDHSALKWFLSLTNPTGRLARYSPQINTVERYNKTIMTCVSTFVDNDHRAWDTNIPKIQFAINNSVNESTGYTPSFLVYGRNYVRAKSLTVGRPTKKNIYLLIAPVKKVIPAQIPRTHGWRYPTLFRGKCGQVLDLTESNLFGPLVRVQTRVTAELERPARLLTPTRRGHHGAGESSHYVQLVRVQTRVTAELERPARLLTPTRRGHHGAGESSHYVQLVRVQTRVTAELERPARLLTPTRRGHHGAGESSHYLVRVQTRVTAELERPARLLTPTRRGHHGAGESSHYVQLVRVQTRVTAELERPARLLTPTRRGHHGAGESSHYVQLVRVQTRVTAELERPARLLTPTRRGHHGAGESSHYVQLVRVQTRVTAELERPARLLAPTRREHHGAECRLVWPRSWSDQLDYSRRLDVDIMEQVLSASSDNEEIPRLMLHSSKSSSSIESSSSERQHRLRSDNDKLQLQVTHLEMQVTHLETRLRDKDALITELNRIRDKLVSDWQAAKLRYEAERDNSGRLQLLLDSQKETCDSLQKQDSSMINILKKRLESSMATELELQQQVQHYRARLATYEAQSPPASPAAQHVSNMTRNMTHYRARLATYEAQSPPASPAAQHVSNMTRNMTHYRERLATHEAQSPPASPAAQHADTIERLRGETSVLKSRLDVERSRRGELQAALETLSAQAQRENNGKSEQINELRQELAEIRRWRCRRLFYIASRLDVERSRCGELQAALETLSAQAQRENNGKSEQINELRQELAEIRRLKHEAGLELVRAQELLHIQAGTIRELERKLSAVGKQRPIDDALTEIEEHKSSLTREISSLKKCLLESAASERSDTVAQLKAEKQALQETVNRLQNQAQLDARPAEDKEQAVSRLYTDGCFDVIKCLLEYYVRCFCFCCL